MRIILSILCALCALCGLTQGQGLNLRDPAFLASIIPASSGSSAAPTLTVTNNLVHWLKADSITNLVNDSDVVYWPDDSPSAPKPVTYNGVGNSKPKYKTNSQNGLPSVDFDGVDDQLTWVSSSATPSNTVSMFLAFRQRTTSGFHGLYIFGTGGVAGYGLINNFGPRSVLHRGIATCDDGTCQTNAEVWGTVKGFPTSAEAMWVNGTNVSLSNSASNVNAADNGITVGSFASLFLDGQIYEALLYERPLDGTERTNVFTYLMDKWNIH